MTTPSALNPGLPPPRTVRVDLGPRAYDVLIGHGLLDPIGGLMKGRVSGRVAIITDDTVAGLLSRRVEHLLAAQEPYRLTVPAGETSKSMAYATNLLSELAAMKLPRSGTVIGLGGGVVGDLAGFVAATYLRGVNFVQVPTTLLAMVDSSVGGKTGVNLPEGKNLVGAFYQPKLVVADLDTLKTLPAREFSAGMAEIIKYGAIADRALFDRVAEGVGLIDPDLAEIIEKCVTIKARIVEQDEFETGTRRALLNFGHTLGHAIEKATGYEKYLHGEAIGLGMRAAAWLSHWQTGLSQDDVLRLEGAIASSGLPMQLDKEIDPALIRAALGNDKKVAADGRNRWVLLTELGQATSGWEIGADVIDQAIERLYPPSMMVKR